MDERARDKLKGPNASSESTTSNRRGRAPGRNQRVSEVETREPNALKTPPSSPPETVAAARQASDEALLHAKRIAKRGHIPPRTASRDQAVGRERSLTANPPRLPSNSTRRDEEASAAADSIQHAKSVGKRRHNAQPVVGAHSVRNSTVDTRSVGRTKSRQGLNFWSPRRHKSEESSHSDQLKDQSSETQTGQEQKTEEGESSIDNSQEERLSNKNIRPSQGKKEASSPPPEQKKSVASAIKEKRPSDPQQPRNSNGSMTSEEFLMDVIRHRALERAQPSTRTAAAPTVMQSTPEENAPTTVEVIPGAEAIRGAGSRDDQDESSEPEIDLESAADADLRAPLIEAVLVDDSDSSSTTQSTFEDDDEAVELEDEIVQAEIVKSSDFWNNPKAKLIVAMILVLIVAVVVMAVVLVGNRGDTNAASQEEDRNETAGTPVLGIPTAAPIVVANEIMAPTSLPTNLSASSLPSINPPATPKPSAPPIYNTSTTLAPSNANHSNVFSHAPSPTSDLANGTSLLPPNNTEVEQNSSNPDTEAPSTPPCSAPALAPTAVDMDSINWTNPLNLSLPDYSILSLQDKVSPQTRAYKWLELHPEIDNMPEWRKQQLYAMVTIYYSLNGEAWVDNDAEGVGHDSQHWLNYSVDECQWGEQGSRSNPGNKCNATSGELQELWLDDINSLYGTMPREVELLKQLQKLGAERTSWNNSLEESMPKEIANLQELQWVHYENAFLLGTIPTYFGAFTQLERLRFNGNWVSGPVPTQIGLLTNLLLFYPSENKLTGTLPSELGLLTRLALLRTNGNKLEGRIPTEYGKLTNLAMLTLFVNRLSGPIPSQLGSLAALTQLEVHSNALSGTLPSEIGKLTKLKSLRIDNNAMVGQVPSELGLLTSLKQLQLHDNDLTGDMPLEICALPSLETLWVSCWKLRCPDDCICTCCGAVAEC